MKKYLGILLSLLISSTVFGKKSEPTIIYGEDNRQDVELMDDKLIQELGKSIAGRVANFAFQVDLEANKIVFDHVGSLSDPTRARVCSDERFAQQKTAVDCTSFLIGDDLLVTAGHCAIPKGVSVRNQVTRSCADHSWVFDYHASADLENINPDNVYGCEKVIIAEYTDVLDFALIKLNRKVVGRKPLELSTESPTIGAKLFVMGHPSGLPLKYADGARVFEIEETYFGTNLDTFGGNSGSPVFNGDSMKVEGILVRGDVDYVLDKDDEGAFCRRVNICNSEREECLEDNPHILGEHVTFISYISNEL